MKWNYTPVKLLLAAAAPLLAAYCIGVVSSTLGPVSGLLALFVALLIPAITCFALGFLDQRFAWHLAYALFALEGTFIGLGPCTGFSITDVTSALVGPGLFGTVATWLLGLLGSVLGILMRNRRRGLTVPTPGRCPTCGYDVRKLPRRVCPECGRPFELDEVGLTSDDLDEPAELRDAVLPPEYARLGPFAQPSRPDGTGPAWECVYQEARLDDQNQNLPGSERRCVRDGKWHAFGSDCRSLYRVTGRFLQILLPDEYLGDEECARLVAAMHRCGIVSGNLDVVIRRTSAGLEVLSQEESELALARLDTLTPENLRQACQHVSQLETT